MRKRDIAIAAGLLLALPLLGGLFTVQSQCQRDQDAYGAQTGQRQRAQKSEFAFDRRWLPCLVEQITADPQPRDSTEKENRDLAAQETAAGAAFWIGVVALLQLVATVWGLLYIRGTLKATLAAVEDTSIATEAMNRQNQIAVDAQRPWIDVNLVCTKLENTVDKIAVRYVLELKNIGKTLALNVHTSTNPSFGGRQERHRDALDEFYLGLGIRSPRSIMPGETVKQSLGYEMRKADIQWDGEGGRGLGKQMSLTQRVTVHYRTPSDIENEFRTTERFFRAGCTHEDPEWSELVYEHDIRRCTGDDVIVEKTELTFNT